MGFYMVSITTKLRDFWNKTPTYADGSVGQARSPAHGMGTNPSMGTLQTQQLVRKPMVNSQGWSSTGS